MCRIFWTFHFFSQNQENLIWGDLLNNEDIFSNEEMIAIGSKNRNSKKSATIFFSGVSIMPDTEKTMDVYFSNLCFWTQNNHLVIWGYLLIEEIFSVPKIAKMGVGQNKKIFLITVTYHSNEISVFVACRCVLHF